MPSQSPKKILITGSTGLVGSRFLDINKDTFFITTIGRENTDILINLTAADEVKKAIEKSDSEAIINFAAYTKVDEAEKDKGNRTGEAYTINVLLPSWLAEVCKATGKILYHISTDFVFDGKQEDQPYTEEDTPHPVNSWYAQTKYEGETEIMKIGCKYSIIRISYPYSGVYKRKQDVASAVVSRLQKKEIYQGITDQKIKPTSTDDIANALTLLIDNNYEGIFHIAGNFSPAEYITPYGFATEVAHIFGLDTSLIKPISFKEFSKKRTAQRPQHTWLSTKKIESLDFQITSIDRALERFMNQMINK